MFCLPCLFFSLDLIHRRESMPDRCAMVPISIPRASMSHAGKPQAFYWNALAWYWGKCLLVWSIDGWYEGTMLPDLSSGYILIYTDIHLIVPVKLSQDLQILIFSSPTFYTTFCIQYISFYPCIQKNNNCEQSYSFCFNCTTISCAHVILHWVMPALRNRLLSDVYYLAGWA